MLLNDTQHSSPANNYPVKNGSIAKAEKSCCRVWPGVSSVQFRVYITVLESPRSVMVDEGSVAGCVIWKELLL